MYVPQIVIIGFYFEERRGLATGLAVCGSGFGAFIFNPFAKYLIDEYGWRGAILIEAGIILNCIWCGLLFRPLPETGFRDLEKRDQGEDESHTIRKKLEMEFRVSGQTVRQFSSTPELAIDPGVRRMRRGDACASLYGSDGLIHRRKKTKRGIIGSLSIAIVGAFDSQDRVVPRYTEIIFKFPVLVQAGRSAYPG